MMRRKQEKTRTIIRASGDDLYQELSSEGLIAFDQLKHSLLQEAQRRSVQVSYGSAKLAQKLLPEEMTPEEISDRKYVLSGVDE